MKIRITPLIILFVLVVAACQRPAPILEPKTFKVPRNEEQMLVWLKEQNCEVEKLSENRYSISWKEELPDGRITGITYGDDVCKVLIESKSSKTDNQDTRRGFKIDFSSKNTAHFTFPLSLGINTDVIVSSKVELAQLSMPSDENHKRDRRRAKLNPIPMYHYNYQIRNLQTSQDPVNTFQIYYSENIVTHWRDLPIIIGDIFDPENPQHLKIRDVNSPSNLWETSEIVKTGIKDFKSTMWKSKDLGILPNESQQGFSVQLLNVPDSVQLSSGPDSVPDIVLAGIDIDSRKGEESRLIVKRNGKEIRNSTEARNSGISTGVRLWGSSSISINRRDVDISGTEMVMKILLQSRPQGKVIGPGIISADWDVSKLTQRLETLTSQSVAEGWLDENAAKQLKQYLTDSQTAFPEDRDKAKKEIQKFAEALKEMEINVNLTQEATTLLGTNAVYLLTKF